MAAERPPARANFVLPLLAALAGAAAGSVATGLALVRAEEPSTAASTATSRRDDDTDVRAVEIELRRLADSIEMLTDSLETSRRTAGAAPLELDDLMARIEALAARHADSASTAPSPQPRTRQGADELHALIRPGLEALLSVEDSGYHEAFDALELRLDQTHRLWPMARVLSTYGQPSHVAASNAGLYLDFSDDSASYPELVEPPLVRFLIQEGVVALVQLEVNR